MDFYIVRLCWKNVWRNKRRTLLAVNAIAIGVTWLVWVHNYYDALNEQFIGNAIRFKNGHIVVSAEGFQDYKPSKRYLRNPASLETWIKQRPEIKAYSTRILAQGLLSSPRGSANIWYTGVDPSQEKLTTDYATSLIEGTYFAGKKRGKPIVIGVGIRDRLGIRLGSKVVALTQGVDGSIGNELFYVEGIFNTDSELDKALAFVRMEDARSLLSLPETAVHQVSIILNHQDSLAPVLGALRTTFSSQSLEILSWMDIQRHLMATIELYKNANRVMMMIILFIASVGIANSILMSIMERTREFGVMMAMGTSKAEMVRMVLMETLLLALVGILIGNLLGVGITVYFQHTGFDLKWLTDQQLRMNGTLVQTVSYPTVHWIHNVVVTTAVLALSVVAAMLPIHHITKLRATKALKAN